MANLVSPGYSRSSLIGEALAPFEDRLIEFKGLNRKSYVEDGELSDMKNLTSDNYPLLTPRKLRGSYALPEGVAEPLSIMTRYERLAMIAKKEDDSIAFFYDGNEVTSVNDLTEDTQMVAINTKICFFPEKKYLSLVKESDSVTIGEYGSLDSEMKTEEGTTYTIAISNENATLTFPSPHEFTADDAIDINGTLAYTPSGGTATTKACVISCIIEAVNGNVLTLPRESFIELTGSGVTSATLQGSGSGDTYVAATVKREMPDLEHVIEWNNRLWGASSQDNTIYACKLGDPKNWKYYQGTSLDSLYAQQGTDEEWTGCAAYSSHLIFFKENRMTKIYGTSPSTFQITNTRCFGVEKGSSQSVVVLNNVVLYKSTIGIMAYEGGDPYCVSEKLNMKFKNVVAGTEGIKYYASVEKEDGSFELLVLDIDRAFWHKEDAVRFRSCTILNGKLLFINDTETEFFAADKLYVVNPDIPRFLIAATAEEMTDQSSDYLYIGAEEGYTKDSFYHYNGSSWEIGDAYEMNRDREWMATFGAFDENIEGKKIFSKMSLRFIAQAGTIVTIYIKMDDGEWERIKQFGYAKTGGETVPIVPRRCDRFSIKIVGKGDCEIKSLTRRYRKGSEVK